MQNGNGHVCVPVRVASSSSESNKTNNNNNTTPTKSSSLKYLKGREFNISEVLQLVGDYKYCEICN